MERRRIRRSSWVAMLAAAGGLAAVTLRLLFEPGGGIEEELSAERDSSVAPNDREPETGSSVLASAAGSDPPSGVDESITVEHVMRESAPAADPVLIRGRLLDNRSLAVPSADLVLIAMRDLGTRWSNQRLATTRSGSDGRFEVTVPATVDRTAELLYLAAWRTNESFVLERMENAATDAVVDLGDLEMTPAAEVVVRVTGSDGSPLDDAFVVAAGLAPLETSTTADGIARFAAVPLGESKWSAGAREFAVRSGVDLEVASGRTNEVTIALSKSAAIAGRIFDVARRPLANVLVRATGIARADFSADDGSFSIDDVPAGEGILEATMPGQVQPLSLAYVAPDSEIEWRLPVDALFSGRVVSASGEPVDGAKLSLLRIDASRFRAAARPAASIRLPAMGPIGAFVARTSAGDLVLGPVNDKPRTTVEGEYSQQHVAKRAKDGEFFVYGAESADPLFVVAESVEHGVAVTGPITLRAQVNRAPIVVQFVGGAAVAITVTREGGDAVEGAECKITNAFGFAKVIETDHAGRATASGVPPGACAVVVTHPSFPLASAGAELERDRTTDLSIQLSTPVAVEGRVTARDGEAISGARVFVNRVIPPGTTGAAFVPRVPVAWTMTDDSGNYYIDRAPPGDVTFEIVPNVKDVILGANSVVPISPITVRLGSDAEQRVDLHTDWPGVIAVAVELVVGGARVEVGRVEIHRLAPGFGDDVTTRHIVDGEFRGTFVCDKEYRFAVCPRGEVWYFSDPVTLTGGTSPRLLIAIPATPVLTGRVEDERGAPIAGAQAYVGWTDALLKPIHGGRAYSPSVDLDHDRWRSVTAGDGTFLLPPAQIGAHVLVVTAAGFEPSKIPLTDEVARRIPLRLPLMMRKKR